ncbi:hypothetical protein CRI94_05565 [Longibacter salinarum]|uniref:Uncharacterized protein n=1 Tax=Longibacter salinarum TaxID=1850348 RepID=A0A2A8D111_9BACT|nr:hypothetical protein CRI94_05565 [Longibacter salinarum]
MMAADMHACDQNETTSRDRGRMERSMLRRVRGKSRAGLADQQKRMAICAEPVWRTAFGDLDVRTFRWSVLATRLRRGLVHLTHRVYGAIVKE